MSERKTRSQGSKWIRPEKRLAIYLRDGFRCAYCGCELHEASRGEVTLDHVKPFSKGGSNEAANFVTACRSCNSARQDKALRTFVREAGLDLAEVVNRVDRQRRRSLDRHISAAKALLDARDNADAMRAAC